MSDDALLTDSFFFTNFAYNPEVYYFFYIGELKSHGLTPFLEPLFFRFQDRRVECIAIVPDLHDQYNYRNLIVPFSDVAARKGRAGRAKSFRRNMDDFLRSVSPHAPQ